MRFPRLVTVIALIGFVSLGCASLGSDDDPVAPIEPGASEGSDRHDGEHLAAYRASRYTYCDAKMIALIWGSSVDEAKVTLGQKIDSGLTDLADIDIRNGRAQALEAFDSNVAIRCSYEEAGYTYDDAVLLGELWGIDPWDAKLHIERKVLLDDLTSVKQALEGAKG